MKNAPVDPYVHPVSAFIFAVITCAGILMSSSLWTSLAISLGASVIVTMFTRATLRKAFLVLVGFSAGFSCIRIALIALFSPAQASSFSLPSFSTPRFLGSITIGGPVDITAVASSAQSMLNLTGIVIAFCGFSLLIGPENMMHLIPRRWVRMRELTAMTNNVLWRLPRDITTINEAQSYVNTQSRLHKISRIFPSLVTHLVGQSPVHAGISDLRSSATTQHAQWFHFRFSPDDTSFLWACAWCICMWSGIFLWVSL